MLISGQGVLVRGVMPDSPAAKAGVKGDDMLITYDDQKLFSPEQLAKLVMSDKPDRDVNLGIVRQGQLEHLRVTLGAHERQVATAPTTPRRRFVPWWGGDLALPQWHDMWSQEHTNPTAQRPAPGGRFESLSLKKVDDQHFQLELKFTDKDGKMQTRELAGTSARPVSLGGIRGRGPREHEQRVRRLLVVRPAAGPKGLLTAASPQHGESC